MTMLNLIQDAKVDLQDIWRYTFNTWGKSQAEIYLAAIEFACHQLVKSPLIGRPMPDLGVNVRVYRCQHHYIFYMIKQEVVIFLAFVHEKRDFLQQVITRLP